MKDREVALALLDLEAAEALLAREKPTPLVTKSRQLLARAREALAALAGR